MHHYSSGFLAGPFLFPKAAVSCWWWWLTGWTYSKSCLLLFGLVRSCTLLHIPVGLLTFLSGLLFDSVWSCLFFYNFLYICSYAWYDTCLLFNLLSIDLASWAKAKAPAGLSRVIQPTAKAQLKGRLVRFQGETENHVVKSLWGNRDQDR